MRRVRIRSAGYREATSIVAAAVAATVGVGGLAGPAWGAQDVKPTGDARRALEAQPPVLPTPTDEVLVFLEPGADAPAVARAFGLAVKQALPGGTDAFVLQAPSVAAAQAIVSKLRRDARVRGAYVNERALHTRFSFVPNDPYFHRDTPTAGFTGQWHLSNEYVSGRDARVQGAWERNYTGAGVVIGIVDDSLQTAHPDLAPNYDAADSFDFGQNDSDPNPVYSNDQHGISVAGVAAARGGNGIGVTGAAPFAQVAGLREDFGGLGTTAQFANGTLYHSSGGNTTIKVKNHSYGISAPFITSQAERDALASSAAAGTVHCFAAGNDRGSSGQDSNKKHLQSSPDAIAVAALGSDGKFASYSCFGANVFVTAPSNSAGLFSITTTDRAGEGFGYNGAGDSFPDGDYTTLFGGTSSASPLITGVMATVKQANPALNVRLAKHLLARTSDVVDPGDLTTTSDGGWRTNAAGFKFNQNYGFGLVNAQKLCAAAEGYSGMGPLTTESFGTTVNAIIPDNNPAGVTRTFTIDGTDPLEDVLVNLNVTHTYRGDLEAYLTSPSGLTSRLMIRSGSDSGQNLNWTFETNAFWGENPAGMWTIKMQDNFAVDVGTWNSYIATMHSGSPTLATQWAGPGGGVYQVGANWINNTAPGGVGATAKFMTLTGASPATVTVSTPVTLGRILFYNSSGSYTLDGPATITLNNGGNSAWIDVAGGDHAIAAPISFVSDTDITAGGDGGGHTLTLSGGQSWGAGKTVTLQGGTVDYDVNGGTMNVGAGAALAIRPGAVLNAGGSADPFTDTANGALHVAIDNQGTFAVQNGTKDVASISGSAGATSVAPGATLLVGSLGPVSQASFSVNGSADAGNVDLSGAATVGASPAMLSASNVRAQSLSIGAGGNVTIKDGGEAAGVSRVGNLSIGAGGKLDLRDNKLIATVTPIGSWSGSAYDGISGMIASGRNGGVSGNWSGSGIVTSQTVATGGNLTSIGVASAQDVKGLGNIGDTALWAGQTVTGSDTLVMYTYGGDANLDGKINVDDYGRIDFNVPLHTAGWFNGDFNYDGTINVDDYGIIDFNIAIQGPPFSTTGELGNTPVVVPEPAAGLIFMTVAALAGRSRQRRRG